MTASWPCSRPLIDKLLEKPEQCASEQKMSFSQMTVLGWNCEEAIRFAAHYWCWTKVWTFINGDLYHDQYGRHGCDWVEEKNTLNPHRIILKIVLREMRKWAYRMKGRLQVEMKRRRYYADWGTRSRSFSRLIGHTEEVIKLQSILNKNPSPITWHEWVTDAHDVLVGGSCVTLRFMKGHHLQTEKNSSKWVGMAIMLHGSSVK